MGLLNDLLKTGTKRSLYRAPRYLTQRPIALGNVFGPSKMATAAAWRDALIISNVLKSKKGLKYFYRPSTLPMPKPYVSGSDRRMYHPYKYPSPVTIYGTDAILSDVSSKKPKAYITPWEKLMNPPAKIDWRPKISTQLKNAPWWYGFVNADKVWICLQRKMRREMMHVLGIAGKSGNQKTPHYGPYSRVRC